MQPSKSDLAAFLGIQILSTQLVQCIPDDQIKLALLESKTKFLSFSHIIEGKQTDYTTVDGQCWTVTHTQLDKLSVPVSRWGIKLEISNAQWDLWRSPAEKSHSSSYTIG